MEVNVEIVLSYNDEETDWKVKKNISKFIYRLKKYRTGNRFSGEHTYKINQDSELYKQIIEFYKSNRKDVEFICLDYDVKVSDEEFEKAKENDVPFYKDNKLAETLSKLEIGDAIPPELYEVVAEILVFVDDMDKMKAKLQQADMLS